MPSDTSFFRRMFRRKNKREDKEEPTFKVVYLGNVLTGFAKGDGCLEKPLCTLWKNYCQSTRPDVKMVLRLSPGGLKATTQEHGLTEYWGHRVTSCAAPSNYPHIFTWVYRHETTRLKQELRCHAVLCRSNAQARYLSEQLRLRLVSALAAFRNEKLQNQRVRLGQPVDSDTQDPSLSRTELWSYKPPLEKSKAAPKLASIAEDSEVQLETIELVEEPLRSLEWKPPLRPLNEVADIVDTESLVEIAENLVTLSPSGDILEVVSMADTDHLSIGGDTQSLYASHEKLGEHAVSLLDIMLESLNMGGALLYSREANPRPTSKRNRSMSLSAADKFPFRNLDDSAYESARGSSPVRWRRTRSFHKITEEPETSRRTTEADVYSTTGSVSASPERTPKSGTRSGFRTRDETDNVSDESGYSEDKDAESVELKSNLTQVSALESSLCEEFEVKL